MRRLLHVLIVAALSLTLAAPVAAVEPERIEEPVFVIELDLEHELVVFWNITRDGFCTWAESGFQGDPPVLEPVTVSYHQVRSGAIISSWTATRHLELWTLDEGADLSGPCPDTDDSTDPWAVGSARVTSTDNDLEVSGTRANSFGGQLRGTVWDAEGDASHYGMVTRAIIHRNGEFQQPVFRTFLHSLR